ncbi:MAG: SDR family NAD(P)-dependent oxidoreductase [Acidobacteriota bacterium]
MSEGTRRETALITGASSGIGRELARLFARDGSSLVLLARSRPRLDTLADELRSSRGIAVTVLAEDLADGGSPERIARSLRDGGLAVDVLVNNAGFGSYGPFLDGDPRATLELLQVNIAALVHLTRLICPDMVVRRAGRVLNLASTAAFQPGPLMAVYYASKAFVLSFSEALANELAGSGVTVTALCPGPTRSEFQQRAGMAGSRLVSGLLPMMDSAAVARAGYRGMRRGRTLVIPGMVNRLGAFAVRLAPRRLVTALARRLQERTD